MPVQKGCFRSARKSLNWQRRNSGLLVGRLQSVNQHTDLIAYCGTMRSFLAADGDKSSNQHDYDVKINRLLPRLFMLIAEFPALV